MRRAIVLGVLLAIGGVSLAVTGFQGPPGGQGRGFAPQGPPVAEIQKIKDNLYMVTGGGGNTAAFITDSGVVVVDTKLAGWGQAILDKIKTVTDKPVTMIINTHTHGDHTGSNEFFGAVEIVAQDNTKANMERMDAFKGDKSKFLPNKTFKDRMTLLQGKDQIDLFYFGPGHTNGDAWVVFKSLRTMHAGDMFAGKNTPIIDTSNGGSAVNYGKTLASAASTIKDVDTIITGHSTVMAPADLMEYAQFNNDFIEWVQSEIRAGKSVDQAAAEYTVPEKYRGYTVGTFMGGVKGNIQTAYRELGK
jgi:glyoxylase-like metal-dependent hydrolase (beta-lactamase superfamily II)